MRLTRRFWGVVGVLSVVSAGASGFAAPPAVGQASGPMATIDPSGDLVDGTPVTVTFTGLDPGSWVEALQCRAGVGDSYDNCATGDYGGTEADDAGHATITLKVDTLLATGFDGSPTADCRVDACVIAWSYGEGFSEVPLHFTPGGPVAPAPTATVTPHDGLTDYEEVTVEAGGFVWSNETYIFQCAADPTGYGDCDFETMTWVDTSDVSSFTQSFEASAVIDTGERGPVDCRTAGACVVAVTQDYMGASGKTAVVPIAFDPDTEIVVPTISVSPDRDLVDGDAVTTTGSGFRPFAGLQFRLCGPEASGPDCEWIDAWAEVGADGTFTSEMRVYSVLHTPTGDIDCRSSSEPCQLVASSGSVTSPRAAFADLGFDPEGSLLPAPEIDVTPSTNLPEDATVAVAGTGFGAGDSVDVQVCRTGDDSRCDQTNAVYDEPDASGNLAVDLAVTVTFHAQLWTGEEPASEEIDCRAAAGCEVVVTSYGGRQQVVRAPLTFAPPPPEGDQRYVDRVFDEVDVTHDVVYRDTVDADGDPVQLKMDIYEPRDDPAGKRPAVVWMHGGWFDSGDKADMAGYATEFARRGYVAVSIEYRTQDQLDRSDPVAIKQALLGGYDDAAAALAFLHEHSGQYRIDPDAIAVGGASAGAANSFGLAYLPGEEEREGDNGIAAALSIAGVSLGSPDAGDAPVLAFHSSDDVTAPLHLAEWTCADAAEVDADCDTVAYPGDVERLELARQRDIVRRSVGFLAEKVLTPLGYLDDDHEHPTTTTAPTTTTTAPSSTSTTEGPSTPSTTSPRPGGNLPDTGSNATMTLVAMGFGLAAFGVALVLLGRRSRRGGDPRLPGAVAGLLFVAVTIPTLGGSADAQVPPTSTPTTPSTAPPSSTPATTAPHHPTTTTTGPTTTTTGPTTTTTTHGGGEHPPEWTPEQVAYAEKLIADSEMSLERFDNIAVLPLMGYSWFFDGTEVGQYQHWVNVNWIGLSGAELDPMHPESLVFRQTEEGPVLEAAMYIISASHNLENVPEDIAWLPGWHVHDNLCSEGWPPRIVGLTDENGQCVRGTKLTTPPMLHVWTVDTPCGRFAGVDENGLICDHEHPPHG